MPDPRQEARAEAYRRGLMNPEQRAAYEEAMRRGLVPGALDRSMGRRLLDNLDEGFNRSAAGWLQRKLDPQADGVNLGEALNFFNPSNQAEILEGGLADRVLDATMGEDRGYFRSVNDQTRRSAPMIARERERRARYEARAGADPVRNFGDGVASFSGLVAGGAVSPDSWVGPAGGVARGGAGYVAGQIVGRAALGGGAAAGTDLLLQGVDMADGVQDEYSAAQTLGAFALGSGLSIAVDAVRPVSSMVRRAFTDAPPVRPDPPDLTPDADGVMPAAPPPPPDFSIVRPVAPKTPLRDAIGRVREGEVPQMVGDALARAYTGIVSDAHPLVRAVEDLRSQTEAVTGRPMDIRPGEDPRKLTRGRFDWAAIGHQDLLHGVHAYRGLEPTTPALADVISAVSVRAKRAGEKAEDALQRFNEYMVARRSSIEWDRRARGELDADPVSRSKDEADAFVAHIEAQDPEFRALADSVNEFAGGLLKKALDGGLIDRATYDASIASRDFYVPLRRVMEDSVKTGGKGGGKNAGPEVKRFKGSDREVVDPISVLIERTYKLNQRIRQNDLNASFIRMAERLEAARAAAGDAEPTNGWVRRIKAPAKKIDTGRDRATIDMFDDGPDEVWRAGEINDAGKAIIYTWRNGQREAWEVIDQDWGREVFEALGGMSKGMQDTFLNVVAAPTAVLSQTITRDPAFLLSNFIRDQVSSWIVTDVGFKPGEGALGIADELRQTDVSRIYGVSGGISGGAATAMMGDALHRADTMALTKKGIKAKYFSSLGGLLSVSEISETGTRLRIFQRAFERAKKAGFSEYDSLIEASFTARDMIDFGRAGSKMHYTRRLVTFLNAYVQGLDKTLRVLGADGAMTRVPMKDAIRPLFGMQPGAAMRKEDAAALKLAGKAWTKLAAISTFGLGLAALYHDDPDYQQANERMRATHWTIPWGENLVRIPKPFELAFLSNVVERGFEATVGQDDKAWGRMWRGLGMLFAPPMDIPVVAVVGGLKSNTNSMTGRPIVPEHMQAMPPELQYQHWNSHFSRWLGGAIGVSPAKIDYAIQGFGGPIGSYALNAMDGADPDRPSGSWTELPVVRRFVNPSFRGAQDKRDFYDRAGGRTSELSRALNGIQEYIERGQSGAAEAIFADLDEPGRMFVISQMGAAPTRRLNPLERARTVGTEGSRIIGELNGAMPRDEGAPLPAMDRKTRQAVEDAIERITVAEMRNAMIVTRQRGFENREMMDRDGLMEDLRDLSPEVADEFERRMGVGRDRAYDYAALMEIWPQVEQRLRAEGTNAYLDDLASDAQGRTRSWGDKGDDDGSIPEALIFRP